MSVAPADFLAVAAKLESGIECEMRSSTSRSYYAAYHACNAWHQALPLHGTPSSPSGQQGGKHQQLINQLKQPASGLLQTVAIESRKLGAFLETLRGRRVTADYKLTETPLRSEASTQLHQARSLVNRVKPAQTP